MKSELAKGSLILFITISFFNILNYLFHFFMGRMLGPSDYSVLAALMSVIYLLGVPSEAIQTLISKYSSKYNSKEEPGKIKDLFLRSLKRFSLISIVLFFAFLFLAIFISEILKIDYWLLVITGLFIFYSFLVPIIRGVLQGTKRFKELGYNLMGESVIKIILSVLLVIAGLRVYGAMVGVIMAVVLVFFLSLLYLNKLFLAERKNADLTGYLSYGFPVLICITCVVLFYSADILLAKIIFNPEVAGKYAVASMLGKMIFFGTQAIGKAMFPLTSESHEKRKGSSGDFFKSLKIVVFLLIFSLIIFFFFPEYLVGILFGLAYLDISHVVFILGLSYSFLAFANLVLLYLLSIDETENYDYIALGIIAVLQVIILYFSNNSVLEFSKSFLYISTTIFLYSIFLIFRWKRSL